MVENIKLYIDYLIVAVAIIVVAVPEGLPLAVMISLAYSIGKMAKDHNDVKRLAACEIMGGADNICSDKTGTLTENIMKVTKIWAGKELDEISQERKPGGKRDELIDLKWEDIGCHPSFTTLIEQSIVLNISDQPGATDKALEEFVMRCGANKAKLREKHMPPGDRLVRFPFNSTRKRMSTIIENATGNGGYDKRIFMKGGADVIVECCSKYLDEDGNELPLTDVVKGTINNTINKFAADALRTIVVGYKDIQEGENGPKHSDGEQIKDIELSGFTMICIYGIMDIIRAEVPDAVAAV